MNSSEWVWRKLPADEEKMPLAVEYDYERSTIDSSDFLLKQKINYPTDLTGKAALRLRYRKLERLASLHMLPAVASCVLVDKSIETVIRKLVPEDEIFFYPATVRASNGETQRYKLVVPLVLLTCIDLEKCQGVGRFLDINPELEFGYRTAQHFPNCLKGHHIVRDAVYPGNVVVSDALKSCLLETKEPGLNFQKIEDIIEVGYYEDE